MTQNGYAFLGLTALVAALVAIMAFALLRFAAASAIAKIQVDDDVVDLRWISCQIAQQRNGNDCPIKHLRIERFLPWIASL